MSWHVCSLIFKPEEHGTQSIPGDGAYHLVKFPYGVAESWDPDGMHDLNRASVDHPYPSDKQSGLIWPGHDTWAQLYALIYWEDGSATEYRDRFVRDPLNLSTGYDSTCTDHRRDSPGMQCFTKSWGMFVHPGTPLGLMVATNSGSGHRLALAEFKLSYFVEDEIPPDVPPS